MIKPSTGGMYNLFVVDAIGCEKSRSVYVKGPAQKGGADWRVLQTLDGYRPGRPSVIWLDIANLGCKTENNELWFAYDKTLRYDSASVQPFRESGDTLFWRLENMNYHLDKAPFWVHFMVDEQAEDGDTIVVQSQLGKTINETNFLNNNYTTNAIVVTGHDPNDLQASPTGFCEKGIIHPDSTLRYLIRFQNTGTAEAIDVKECSMSGPEPGCHASSRFRLSHRPMKATITNHSSLEFLFPGM
ncbi:MAG: hypothetical protein R3B47_03190 [Bacteroidia bacterium]